MKTLGLLLLFGLVFIATGADVELTVCDRQDNTLAAIKNDDLEEFKRYINNDNKNCLIREGEYESTVLFMAAAHAKGWKNPIAKYLVTELKADANIGEYRDGKLVNTPLIQAAASYKPSKSMVKLLVEDGKADVKKENDYGESPLKRTLGMMWDWMDGGFYTHNKILGTLLKNGAADNNEINQTLLEAAEYFVDSAFNNDYVADSHRRKAKWCFISLAKVLKKYGADSSVTNAAGKTTCDFIGKIRNKDRKEDKKIKDTLNCE